MVSKLPYHVVRAVEPGHGAHQAEGRTCLPGGGPGAADGVKPAQPGIGPVGARRRLPQHRRAGRPCAVEVDTACVFVGEAELESGGGWHSVAGRQWLG